MISSNFLEYEIALILAKYGEKQVLSTLAKNLGLSARELDFKLQNVKYLKPKVTTRQHTDPKKIIDSLIIANPEKSEFLNLLLARFQNRTFLPELKDVKRLLNRYSTLKSSVKSRSSAAPYLFRLLASLDLKELASLCEANQDQDTYSSLGIISDEIMRRNK